MLQRLAVLTAAVCLAFPAATAGADGSYAFDGGTKKERETVVAALRASSFDWSVVPGPIVIHIVDGEPSRSIPGEIWLDADLLAAGEFAWGVVQHEYAHQVDYLLFDEAKRALLLKRLGGRDWCYSQPGLAHDLYGCERFASTLAWSFWPSPENSMRPTGRRDESAAMAPAKFRALVSRLTRQTTGRSVEEALMPGWLMWTLIGLGAWLAASVPFAFLTGYLLSRRPAPRRHVVFLAGPASIRLRGRARSRTLTRWG